jgi:hypothetical protein
MKGNRDVITKRKVKPHALITKMADYNENDFMTTGWSSDTPTEMKEKSKILPHIKTLLIMTIIVSSATFGIYYMGVWDLFGIGDSEPNSMVENYIIGFFNTFVVAVIGFMGMLVLVALLSIYEKIYDTFK